MIGNRRVLGAAVAAVLVASLGALAGCASDEKPEVALTQKQVQAASVTLTVHDVNGAQVGVGSGILIAPRLVLTSGHLVAGKARWSVTSADGTTKVNGIRGMTYDWMDYDNSQNAHPRKHDVAVIYLDKPINLDVYPKLASEGLANNAAGTRLRSNGSSVLQLPQTFKKVVGFPHAYLTDMPSQESVEPGNAVLNEHNEIVGLVTGRGLTTGQMYVARTNDLTDWLQPKAQCGGRSTASVRTYGTPPPKPGCDTPGSSGNTSGGTSGNTSGGTSGNTSGGTSGTSGQSSGTSGNTSGGTSGGTSGNTSGGTSGNTSGGTSGNTSGGTSGTSGQSSGTSGQSSGQTSGGTSGNTSGGTSGNSSSGGAGSENNGDSEQCGGESDNPETCPPENDGCSGGSCGGAFAPDGLIEYGGYTGSPSDDGDPLVVK